MKVHAVVARSAAANRGNVSRRWLSFSASRARTVTTAAQPLYVWRPGMIETGKRTT